jgi:hypothetical protein
MDCLTMKKNTHLSGIAAIMSAIAFLAAVAVGSDEKDEATRREETYNLYLRETKRPAVRRNGVLMTAKAEVKDGKEQKLLVHWTLDYDGPRWPLIIVKPSLSIGYRGITSILFYAFGKDKEVRVFSVQAMEWSEVPFNFKSDYVTAEKGKPAQGILEVPIKQIKEEARRKYPGDWQPFESASLYLRLSHNPGKRGEEYGLDAWTGYLSTQLVPIATGSPTEP